MLTKALFHFSIAQLQLSSFKTLFNADSLKLATRGFVLFFLLKGTVGTIAGGLWLNASKALSTEYCSSPPNSSERQVSVDLIELKLRKRETDVLQYICCNIWSWDPASFLGSLQGRVNEAACAPNSRENSERMFRFFLEEWWVPSLQRRWNVTCKAECTAPPP